MEDSRFSESTHCGAARILHALNREFKVQRTFCRCLRGGLRTAHLCFAQPVWFSHKARHKLAGRIMPAGLRRGILLHTAAVQDGDAVAHAHRLCLIVGHKNRGNAECRGQFRQLMPHLLAEQSVQRGKGFVKQMPPG